MKRLKLTTRFIISFICLSTIMFSVLLVFSHQYLHRFMEDELLKRGVSIARHLSEAAVTPILTENYVSLQGLVSDYAKNEKDVRYIYIVDPSKKVLAHSFPHAFPADLLKIDEQPARKDDFALKKLQSEDELIEHITVKIHNGEFGRVHVGLTSKEIDSSLHRMLLRLVAFASVVLLLGIMVWMAVAASIARPLADLTRASSLLGSGQLNTRVEVQSGGEIGELASSFNQMAEKLAAQQQELAELNQSLEDRIKIALEDLRERDKLLILQSRLAAMGEMINNIAHQWRQPLNNVGMLVQKVRHTGAAGNLTQGELEADTASMMKLIHFMSNTIDDFRNFFLHDKKKVPFSIKEAVNRTVEFMTPSLASSGIRVDIDIKDDSIVEGYPNEYAQVMLNIISNAKDVLLARQIAEPCIWIKVASEEGRSVVSVEDNAGGIAEDILPRIFDPYFTTKGQAGGTGIGLYMSQVIMEKNMKGRLLVRNNVKGAEFIIEL